MKLRSNQLLFYLIISISFFIFSCETSFRTSEEILKYASDKSNGLVQTIDLGDFLIRAKIIPSDYFFLQHGTEIEEDYKNSNVYNEYAHSLYVIMTFQPKNKSDRIIDRETYNIEEYKRKILSFNFGIENMVKLELNEKDYFPVLSSQLNYYELKGSQSAILAFNFEDILEFNTDMELEFHDEIFHSGKHGFIYKKTDLQKIPSLRI